MAFKILLVVVAALTFTTSPTLGVSVQDLYPTPNKITEYIKSPEQREDPYELLFASGFCERYCQTVLECEETLVDLCEELCEGFEPKPVLELFEMGLSLEEIMQANDISQIIQCCDDRNCNHHEFACSRSPDLWLCQSEADDY
ncbi:hypothetical protein BSKO_12076 [Bryopsis sp. KO-2023]|nr:hypothetical protein BSKO_12076 [Bryopsis sp. KO-2023]